MDKADFERLLYVKKLLNNYVPIDTREEISLKKLIELIENGDESIFDRNLTNKHVTGSAIVLSSAGILLHYHKRLKMWIQPGGHLDALENPLDAAVRETREETGVNAIFDPEIFHIDVHDAYDHVHYDIRYLGRTDSFALRPPAGESQSVAWFSTNALNAIKDIAICGGLKKALSMI